MPQTTSWSLLSLNASEGDFHFRHLRNMFVKVIGYFLDLIISQMVHIHLSWQPAGETLIALLDSTFLSRWGRDVEYLGSDFIPKIRYEKASTSIPRSKVSEFCEARRNSPIVWMTWFITVIFFLLLFFTRHGEVTDASYRQCDIALTEIEC